MALTTIDPALQNTQAQYTGFKNRIINGAMTINQRAYSGNPSNGIYTLDRWFWRDVTTGKASVAQSTNAPTGFKNSLLVTSLSAYTPAAGDVFDICQTIEGLNFYDMAWGTVGAQTVTISFWVKSSLTGTFSGVAAGASLSYPFTYTINAANTWEQKTVTISGPTSGTWATDNTGALEIDFSLGCGSTYAGASGSWTASRYYAATGSVNVVQTNSATWQVTGVQLEKGSTATSFDYRPYGTELALCQRYYYKSFAQGTAPAQNIAANNQIFVCATSNTIAGTVFPVAMRANPTVTTFNPFAANSSFRIPSSSTDVAISGVSVADWGITSFGCSAAASFAVHGHYTASAEL